MKRTVWKNASNEQLCVTIPKNSGIGDGDTVEIRKSKIRRITFSCVVGDLFHYGHLQSLQFAKSISDYNVIGLLTDNAVAAYRVKPISNFQERKAVFSSLNCVDRVMIQDSRDSTKNLRKLHEEFPDAEIILVHGDDLTHVHGAEFVKQIGGRVIKHSYYKKLSNFKIINYMIENKDKFKDITDIASLVRGDQKTDAAYNMGNKVIISTKANTLEAFAPILKKSRIENMLVFNVSDWKNRKQFIIDEIRKKFSPNLIVVRSSAVNEDTFENSMAGSFSSILNVNSTSLEEVEDAVRKVIDSYKTKSSESSFNQVLIQTQTNDIVMSGVVFTRTLNSNAPYYVINYDDSTGSTDSVTKGIESKTVKISRFIATEQMPKCLRALLKAIQEIEARIPKMGLDIEFGVNKKGDIIIFQIRPLTTTLRHDVDDVQIKASILTVKERFRKLSKKRHHLAGEKTIFADMPDWNPAEIIGDTPNHLDYSLYDYIITGSAWHEARTSQGYHNAEPAKLVVLLGNKPYVDVRNTFNSFVPAAVPKNLHEKLVSFYIDKLARHPELQDKVEFEIVYSCYDMNFNERSKELLSAGFAIDDVRKLKKALLKLTNTIVIGSEEEIKNDIVSVKRINRERERIKKESAVHDITVRQLLRNAKALLDDCRRSGTVEFSKLARLAFIGKIILKSMVDRKIISNQFYDDFMNSVSTVATEISEDFRRLCSGSMDKEDFIEKYYHLRPRSYDITSQRYESQPDLIKAIDMRTMSSGKKKTFNDRQTMQNITRVLKKEGLSFDAYKLLDFAKSSLEAREYSKFEFTKNLSDAIELIARAGDAMGFSRNEMALLDINEIISIDDDSREAITRKWKDIIKKRGGEREINQKIVYPPVIITEKDFDVINYYTPRPNYITHKKAAAKVVKLDKNVAEDTPDITGKIVMIENGDPGYDWIFTRNIAGLVTKFGGVASHMSIRCAEFGIPAAIGCGIMYDNISMYDSINLDCSLKKITPIGGFS